MIFIEHRKNNISDLASVNPSHGVEIDLRSNVNLAGQIHLSHEPWILGEDFNSWLISFKKHRIQGPLILNTKEDGLESLCTDLLKKHQLENFLFLDTQVPTMAKLIKMGLGQHLMVRLSSLEPIEFSLNFKNSIGWAWVDCFDCQPLPVDIILVAKQHFKLCMVAPELQGEEPSFVANFKSLLPYMDAICTKRPQSYA